jgi:NAD(P)-dependent dehydrogenase (short-subunit alcohol dehydrogenase family)
MSRFVLVALVISLLSDTGIAQTREQKVRADKEKVANFGKDSPMKRPAQPEELAPAYVFLASNADSSYITGTILQVMGGETIGG